ncbi:L-histidine N(alpha)-methyltransferase [bacterium]|jgi:L-histidine Nalpha-methyltransferase|nr:L-histidine N(alpha)-methyltransferase [bacterium]
MKISNLIKETTRNEEKEKKKFEIDISKGLIGSPKRISSKYFYDDIGSKIFQKITKHHDYYPTKTEYEILENIKDELPKILNEDNIDIIELGVGDGHKTNLLIQGFLDANKRVNFYPIDISSKAMTLLETSMPKHRNLNVHCIIAEYSEGLTYLKNQSENQKIVLFLGSNIGNFNQIESISFLKSLREQLNINDYVLTGFDLKKDTDVLNKAYNDSSGHTEAFNLNLLNRINSELDADFDISKFQHYGFYNPTLGAMESYLLSKEKQTVQIKKTGNSIRFNYLEPIHLEYSFKFLESDINYLSKNSGYTLVKNFSDSKKYFTDSLWKV